MSCRVLNFLLLIIAVCFSAYGYADPYVVSYSVDPSELNERGRFMDMLFDREHNTITLNDRLLIEDDAPAIGVPEHAESRKWDDRPWSEKIHGGVRVKKILIIDGDPGSFNANLVFCGIEHENNEYPLHISVNGTEFIRPATKYAYPYAKHLYMLGDYNYFSDNWFVVHIPSGALDSGENEIILWAESEEPSWEIMVAAEEEYAKGSETRLHHPNRSMKSVDSGETWRDDRLGWTDAFDGEYAIRLSLDQWVPEGTYESPVYDLAEAPDSCETLKKLLDVRRCSIEWNVDIPEHTKAIISVRFGNCPVPAADSWSSYEKVIGTTGKWTNPTGRYFQFRVRFETENPLETPELHGINVTADVSDMAPESSVRYTIKDFRNGKVIRPSVTFTHEDYEAMREFRDMFELDNVVEGAATEFEKQLRLLRWAYRIPVRYHNLYSWDYREFPVLQRDENGEIMLQSNYEGRRRDVHCLFSNVSLVGACLAMGYPARYVNLQTEGRRRAHEVMEVWSNDFNKWVFLDATRDYYTYDPDTGIPLSLREINERVAGAMERPSTWEFPAWWQQPDDIALWNNVNVRWREGDNTYSIYDERHGPRLLLDKSQLHMVLRNDFVSRPTPVPWRVDSNWGGPQFYGWYNEKFPRKREYARNTNRWQDFDFTLNQAELTVAETDTPGVLTVHADTETPCFESFAVMTDDDGVWRNERGYSFEWNLHEGINKIRVCARNTAGVMGHESTVTVIMNK